MSSLEDSSALPTPEHVAIIMDGNGRWAKRRGLPRIAGHRQGVENVRKVVKACGEMGIRYLTLYAFSAENWNRPQDEIDALMDLLVRFLDRHTGDLIKQGVRLATIGDLTALPERAQVALDRAKAKTMGNDRGTLILALNYGARRETVTALQRFARDIAVGRRSPDDLSWEDVAGYLDTAQWPDPDLIIRTSGETRLSNFLLLQAAYAELYFTPVHWPDFGPDELATAVRNYQQRERRFGRTGEQLRAPVLKP